MRKISFRMTLALALCLTTVLLFAGCSSTGSQPQGKIKIGAFLPLSGWAAEYGKEAQNGINLAIAAFNDAGGANGKLAEAIYEDSAADAATATSAAKKLIEVDKVKALVGAVFSHEAFAAAPLAEQNKVILIAGQASHPELPLRGDYIFALHPNSVKLMNLMVDYAYKEKGYKKAAMLAFDTDFGRISIDAVKARYAALGGEVPVAELYPVGTTDFKTQLLKVKEANPDVLALVGGPVDVIQIIKQMSELGVKLPIMGSNMLREKAIVEAVGPLFEGAFYTNPGPASPEARKVAGEFLERYKEAYGGEPRTVTPFLAYEGAALVLNAIKEVGEAAPDIQKWITNVKDFKGALGEISFTEKGEPIRPLVIEIVKDGKFVVTDYWSYGD